MKGVTADTKMRISEMQLLPVAERNLLLEKMGQYAAYLRNENIVSLFEKKAAEHPEHLAVVYGHSAYLSRPE